MEEGNDMAKKVQNLREALNRVRLPPAYDSGKWFVGPLNFKEEVRAGMTLPDKVEICDVTLREATQAYLTEKEYIALGMALDEAGVSVIQFLRPGGGAKEAEHMKALKVMSGMGTSAKFQLYGVNLESEMDMAAQYGVDTISYTIFPLHEWQPIYAARRRSAGRSAIYKRAGAVKSQDELIEYMEIMAEAVKARGMRPRPIANFFSMASIDFLKKFAKACESADVYALNFVDAAGNMGPAGFRYVISEVKKAAPRLKIGIHAHNDLGLATANALAGVEAGASQIDVTVNGLGARAGNAALAEVAVSLEALYGIQTGIKLEKLTPLSKMFEDMARWPTPKDMPLVGEYAYTDASETHCFLLQADPLLFAPVRPEVVGNKRRTHMDLKSGVNALKMRLQEIGLSFSEEKLESLLAVIRSELVIKRRPLTEEEMRDCIDKTE